MTKKKKSICSHEKKVPSDTILYRCACGNVWMNGKFYCSIDKEQSAVSVLGSVSFAPASERKK